MSNPWGVTPAQARAMDALIRYENAKAASRALSLTTAAFSDRIKRVKARMGCTSQGVFTHILKWDRWRREQESGIAAQQFWQDVAGTIRATEVGQKIARADNFDRALG